MVLLPGIAFSADYDFRVDLVDENTQEYYLGRLSLKKNNPDDGFVTLTGFDNLIGKENDYVFNIPETVTTSEIEYTINKIDDKAFAPNTNKNTLYVYHLVLPPTIKQIGERAFYDMKLKSISLPEGLESIGKEALYNNSALEELVIPNGVKEIPEKLCEVASSLKKLYLGENITTIGQDAFYQVYSIEEIHIKAVNPPSITNAFDKFKATAKIYVPEESTSAYEEAWGNDTWLKGRIEILAEDGSTSGVTGVDATNDIQIRQKGNQMSISGATGKVELFAISGIKLAEFDGDSNFSIDLPKGLYIICTAGNPFKIMH